MAFHVGFAGFRAASRGAVLVLGLTLMMIVFLILPALFVLVLYSRAYGWAGIVTAVVLVGAFWLWNRNDLREARDLLREGVNWLKGAVGERRVRRTLAELPDEFILFHDLCPRLRSEGKKWNIDHVVIGPTGIFSVETKFWRRTSVPSASTYEYTKQAVDQAERNALELKDRLKLWSNRELDDLFVVGVVVFAQDAAQLETLREGHVRTLPLRLLLREIQTHEESAIDEDRAARAAAALFSRLTDSQQEMYAGVLDAYRRRMRRDSAGQGTCARTPVSAGIPTVCPKCGGELVRYTARKGTWIGDDFLGCPNWSRTGCDYKHNLGRAAG